MFSIPPLHYALTEGSYLFVRKSAHAEAYLTSREYEIEPFHMDSVTNAFYQFCDGRSKGNMPKFVPDTWLWYSPKGSHSPFCRCLCLCIDSVHELKQALLSYSTHLLRKGNFDAIWLTHPSVIHVFERIMKVFHGE